jgi:nitrite reductase/ring-hydroxylating ferredoxin subunit
MVALRKEWYFNGMEEFANVQCPFCGQSFDVAVDTSVENQCFTTDCEVCCRPFEVRVECEDGEITLLEVAS